MKPNILPRILMPVIAAFGLAACYDTTPETSKIEKNGVRYTLGTGTSQGKGELIYLEGYVSPSSTVYFFNDNGYDATKTTTYTPMFDPMFRRPPTPLIDRFKASKSDADHKAKLDIGCELARKTKGAPAGDERVEADRRRGTRFLEAHCP